MVQGELQSWCRRRPRFGVRDFCLQRWPDVNRRFMLATTVCIQAIGAFHPTPALPAIAAGGFSHAGALALAVT